METIKNGNPNLSNERVLASFLDLIGMNVTMILRELAQEGKMSPESAIDLGNIRNILARMRDTCGVNTPWHGENLFLEAMKHCEAADAQRKANRPSPAEVADAILNDLNNN